jgi:ABC-2 type transport system permease protein
VTFQRQAIDRELTLEHADWSEWREETRRIETGQSPDSPFSARNAASMGTFYGRTATLPPGAFALTSIGQSDVYPYFYKVRGERRDAFLNSQEMENPLNLLHGRFDLAFALVYLLPLIILALSFDLLSSEREFGTLPLVLSQGVTSFALIVGKAAARGMLVVGSVTVVVFAGLVIAGEPSGIRWAWWWAMAGLYAALWFAIAALVNTRRWSSTTNAVALAAVWVLLVLLIPALVHITASSLSPVPSRTSMIEATRLVETEVRDMAPGLLTAYYEQHPDVRPAGYDPRTYDFPVWWTAIQGEVNRRMDPVLARMDRALDEQQAFVNRLSLLSPALLVQEVCNELAGTGWARQRRFTQQVTEFHDAHRAFYEPKAYGKIKLVSSDYDRMPRFTYQEETPAAIAGRVGWRLAWLGFLTLAVTWLHVPARSITSPR